MFYLFFFFFKQKTAYEMRISDGSSDVCSSDLFDPNSIAEAQKSGFRRAAFDGLDCPPFGDAGEADAAVAVRDRSGADDRSRTERSGPRRVRDQCREVE